MLILFWYLLHGNSYIFLFNSEIKQYKNILLLRAKAGFLFSPPFKLLINNLFVTYCDHPNYCFLFDILLTVFSGQYMK